MILKSFQFPIQKKIHSFVGQPFQFFSSKPGRLLVVDFNQSMIKLVYLEPFSGGFKLLNYGMQPIGSIQEKKEQAAENFLNNFLRKYSIFGQETRVNLSEAGSVIIKYLDLPVLPRGEIISAAKWQLKEDVPFNLETACIDWQIVKEYTDEEGIKKNGIIFAIAKREGVDSCLSFIYKCHLIPSRITVAPFNYANILNYLPSSQKISAVLDIDFQESTLNIYENNKLHFVRKLPISWEKFTLSLMGGGLVSEKGGNQLSYEEAEEIKNTFGIPLDENQVIHEHIQSSQVISLIRPLLETLVRELKFSFDYFTSTFDAQNPSILYLTGGGANLKNLDSYLNKELHREVKYLPFPDCVHLPHEKEKFEQNKGKNFPFQKFNKTNPEGAEQKKIINAPGTIPVLEKKIQAEITGSPPLSHEKKDSIQKKEKLSHEDQNVLINTIGAALGDLKSIDLLPVGIKKKKKLVAFKIFFDLGVIFLGIVFLFVLFLTRLQTVEYRNKLKISKAHLKTIEGIKTLKEKIRLREELMDKIQAGTVPPDGVLKVISNLIPTEIILDELEMDQSNHSLVLRGAVSGGEDVAGLIITHVMTQLEASLFFSEVSLISSQRVGVLQKFEIKCTISN